jgi:formate hydrogenlyase transcriptional activator
MSLSTASVFEGNRFRENCTMTTSVNNPNDAMRCGPQRTEPSFLETIVGRQGALRSILEQAKAVASTQVTVLITGETGTGKEVIAQALHELSPRRSRSLVNLNCAAMPGGLLESELFGHERGAFTGAVSSHPGRFVQADRGTLFLDEIGDMPPELQPKLLRVLQEREFQPVGSIRNVRVDVRVVAATNRDLRQMVLNREFREDLYYRLNTFPIWLPPLRERKADIPEFVNYFLQHYSDSLGKPIESIPDDTMRALVSYSWPGNIRELQNYIARGVILSVDGEFEAPPLEQFELEPAEVSHHSLEDTVRQRILDACERTNWKIGGPQGAAAKLGIKRTTLFMKIKRMGIKRPSLDFEE